MKFDSRFYLKWIESNNSTLGNIEFNLVHLCVLAAKDQRGELTGFTVFEAKHLDASFFERLDQRKKRELFSHLDFVIYLPVFLQTRLETLLKSFPRLKIEIRYAPILFLKLQNKQLSIRDRVRVINVDDSPVLLKFLKKAVDELGFIDVVGQVSDPVEAVSTIQRLQPDLITLDIQMPKKTGVEVLRDLFNIQHYPVIMISSLSLDDGSMVFDALNSGAFDYIQKPKLEELSQFKEELSSKILSALEGRRVHSALQQKKYSKSSKSSKTSVSDYSRNLIWCLGSSTGGTQALTRIFTSLPNRVPPTLIVQHIPPVFSRAFAESLNQLCPFTVKEAEDGELLLSDKVYIAPGGKQMRLEKKSGKYCIVISDDPPINRFKPSVDYMFFSVAKFQELQVVAGVLTGMGRDGAEGLLGLKKIGAKTFVQDEETSAVYGMPRVAFELGGAEKVVPLDNIAETLLQFSASVKKAG